MKLIGKGTFTKAFLLESGKVELHSIDPVKECMSLYWFTDSFLFPDVTRKDYLGEGVGVYEMEYYPKQKSLKNTLDEHNYNLYKALRKLSIGYEPNSYRLIDRWRSAFESLNSQFNKEKEQLFEALNCLCNYGTDILFEISPRNVAVKDGKLILLDCFFFRSKLKEVTGR